MEIIGTLESARGTREFASEALIFGASLMDCPQRKESVDIMMILAKKCLVRQRRSKLFPLSPLTTIVVKSLVIPVVCGHGRLVALKPDSGTKSAHSNNSC